MNKIYLKFLSNCNIISEEDFMSMLNQIPDIDWDCFDWDEFDIDEYDDIENIASEFIYVGILNPETKYAYVDGLDLEEKTIELWDISDKEELDKLNNIFTKSGWTISNYSEIKESLEERKVKSIAISILNNFSEEELTKFIKDHEQK